MENFDKILPKVLSSESNDEWVLTIMQSNQRLPQLILSKFPNIPNFSYKHLKLLVNVLKKLRELSDDAIELWVRSARQQRYCILTLIFESMHTCLSEQTYASKLIEASDNPNQQLQLPLYDYVYYNVCSFITTLNSEQFKYFEQILFECLISDSYITSLFASDVWCFVAKYSSPQLCYDYCCFLMKQTLVLNKHTNRFTNIISLLNRIMHILEEEHIINFVKIFSLSEYPEIWIFLDLKCLLTQQRVSEFYNELYGKTISESSTVFVDSLILLSQLIIDDSSNKMKMDLFNLASNMYLTLSKDDTQLFQAFSAIFINLFANDLQMLQTLNYFEIFLDKLTENFITYEMLFAKFITIISQIKDMNSMVEKQLKQHIISILSKLFDKNTFYYTRYNNLVAMSNFALKSEYKSVIIGCCQQSRSIKDSLYCHLTYLKNKKIVT